jgi:cell division transport system permease protein
LANFFFLGEALRSFRRSPFMALIAAGSIAMALMAQGAYWLCVKNARYLLGQMEARVELVAYFHEGLDDAGLQAAAAALKALPGCTGVKLVSSEDAVRELSSDPDVKPMLEVLDKNPLPASARLQVDPATRSAEGLQALAAKARQVAGVDAVDYGRETVEKLLAVFGVARLVLWLAGLVFSVAALLIVSNVIRLTVFARREEVSIMKLVGASNTFIRLPFLAESALLGLAGGMVASGVLKGLGQLLSYRIHSELRLDPAAFFPVGVTPEFAGQLAAAGLGLGLLAGVFSVGRHLKA